jgi:hypothetical protein
VEAAMIHPNSVKQLTRLMLSNERLIKQVRTAVREADQLVNEKLDKALYDFIMNGEGVSTDLLSASQVQKAVDNFYREGKFGGQRIKLY